MPPVIRSATPADAEVLARLRYDLRAAIETPVETLDAFTTRWAAWSAPRLKASDRWQAWVADADGALCGMVWLGWIEKLPNPVNEREWHGYVSSLYVRPDHRGHGTGTALLEAALATCDARGVEAVILWPTPPSRSLYERHGFRQER